MRVSAALFCLFAAFAPLSMAGEPPAGTPVTQWTPPTEAGVGWDSGDYAYDDSGNIARIGQDTFGYDGVNRLTAGTVTAHGVASSQTFRYDRYGNLLSVSNLTAYGSEFPLADAATLSVSTDTNRLDSACHPSRGCETWSYDGDTGNLTRNRKALGGTVIYDVTYDWDPIGAMRELDGSLAHERYVYDANDERIVMVSLDGDREVVRRWTWRDAANKVAREAVEHVGVERWSEARDYVHREGALLASFESANAAVAERHYHVDHLGTPRLITDAGRRKLAIEAYLPFGERAPGGESAYIGFTERMRFTGHERDGDRSPHRPTLDYMHARYYTAEWGRFLSPDPVLGDPYQPQSWNRYAYARNSPLLFVDPTGEFIDVSNLTQNERDALIQGLNDFTGNTYEVDKNNRAVLVTVGANSSAAATAFLDNLIGSTSAYTVAATTHPGESWYNAAQNRIELDFGGFDGAQYNGVDARTFNIGSTAIHEWIHQYRGLFDTLDGTQTGPQPQERGWTGPVVDAVNGMRWERGLPLRMDYVQLQRRPTGFLGFFGIGTPRAAMRFYDPQSGRIREVIRNDP